MPQPSPCPLTAGRWRPPPEPAHTPAGAEKKAAAKLQEPRTVRKIVHIDDHICLAFAGLTADARVLIDKARVEAQNFRLSFDEPASVDYITKHIAQVQQQYTQGRGRRPFGISTLIVGFSPEGEPQLYQTDPSGIYSAWKANAIGRNAKTVRSAPPPACRSDGSSAAARPGDNTAWAVQVREYLEKNYSEVAGRDAVKLCVKSLMEMIEASGQTIEVMVMKPDGLAIMDADEIDAVVKEVEADTAAAEAARRSAASGAGEPPAAGAS